MARPEVEHIVTAKYMHGRCGARWVFPLALAVIPVMAEGQEPSSPPSPLVQDAPLTDFSLDLDESLDVGVAWPDLEAKSAEALAVAVDGEHRVRTIAAGDRDARNRCR